MQKTILLTVALLNSVALAIDITDEAPESSILNLSEVQLHRDGGRRDPPTSEECRANKEDEADERKAECDTKFAGDQTAIDDCKAEVDAWLDLCDIEEPCERRYEFKAFEFLEQCALVDPAEVS